jgi:hypothetical protein
MAANFKKKNIPGKILPSLDTPILERVVSKSVARGALAVPGKQVLRSFNFINSVEEWI